MATLGVPGLLGRDRHDVLDACASVSGAVATRGAGLDLAGLGVHG